MVDRFPKAAVAALALLILSSVMAYAIAGMVDDTSGYVPANVLRVVGNTIIIGNDCTAIVADTSPERAMSIQNGIDGVIDTRPNTHDTFLEALRSFNITLDYVTIDRYDGENFYSNLVLSTDIKMLKLDTRPSDAMAMAVRANATIYINSVLLDAMGQDIC